MPMTLQRLIDGPHFLALPEQEKLLEGRKRVFDDHQYPLHGLYLLDRGFCQEKWIVSDGNVWMKYLYEPTTVSFHSAYVNDWNLYCCLGQMRWMYNGIEGSSEELSIARVVQGSKPFGSCLATKSKGFDPAVQQAAKAKGIIGGMIQGTTVPVDELYLAQPGTFGGLFDLDAFASDWHRQIELSPVRSWLEGGNVGLLVKKLENLPLSYFVENAGKIDLKRPQSVEDWMTFGLLFGYPIETTAYKACWQ